MAALTITSLGVVSPANAAATAAPQDLSVNAGEEARFDATSDTAGATYQWFFRHPSMPNFAPAGESTARSPILVIPGSSTIAANDGVQFRATITFPGGVTTQTPAATLRILPWSVTAQPSNVTTVAGQQVTFSADFGSPGATVQWYYKHPTMAAFAPAGEATARSRSLVLPGGAVILANSGVQFKAVFTLAGKAYETTAATLTVSEGRPPTVGLLEIPSAARTVTEGVGLAFATSIDRSNVTVQWLYKHPSMPKFAPVGETPQTSYADGSTTTILTLPPAAIIMANNGVQFKAVITAGTEVFESNAAQVTILPRVTSNAPNCVSLACGVSIITEYGSRIVRDSRPGQSTLITKMQPAAAYQAWRIDANADGSVRFVNESNGQCMVSETEKSWEIYKSYPVSATNCTTSDYAKWYFQPQPGTNRYAIRNVATNECVDVRGPSDADDTPIQTRPCSANQSAQRFTLTNTSTDAVSAVMTTYAMKLCDAGSSAVTCAYENVSESRAALSKPERVSELHLNGTNRDSTLTMNWSATKTVTQSFSYTYTVGATVGWWFAAIGPNGSVTVSQAFQFAKSWADGATEGAAVSTTVSPGEYGWVTRAQLTKAITGTWTMSTSQGTSWTAEGTTTMPAKAGTDGQSSVLITCSSSSTLKACIDTAPAVDFLSR